VLNSHFKHEYCRDGYQNCNHSAISQGGVNVVGTTLSPLDAGQLAMIARLVGPTGVRTIESALLGVVKHHVKAVKAAISKHVTVLESLEDDCTEADTLRGTIKECQSSLSHLFQTLMRIGDALVLRRLLLSASARVQQETAPVLPWVAGLAASTVQAIMQQLVPQCDGSSIAAFDFDALVPPPASIASNVVEALWDRLGVSCLLH
jgi:Membrane-associated apoptosis protein